MIFFARTDFSEGLFRMWLSLSDRLGLGVISSGKSTIDNTFLFNLSLIANDNHFQKKEVVHLLKDFSF